jgi:hypothetical protein
MCVDLLKQHISASKLFPNKWVYNLASALQTIMTRSTQLTCSSGSTGYYSDKVLTELNILYRTDLVLATWTTLQYRLNVVCLRAN